MTSLATFSRAALLAFALSGCLAFHKGAMPGEPKDATFLEVEGARVRYVDKGEGPVVVLLHGYASAIEAWSTVMPELVKSHRVIALDLKGFGWSDRPEGDYSPEAEAKLVLALLDARGVDKFAIVAHSWGSSVGLALALAAPERATRIALYDAWVYEEQLPTAFVMARAGGVGEAIVGAFYPERADEKLALAFYDPTRVTEELAEAEERAMERPGTLAAALAGIRGQRFEALQAKYKTIDKPVLLLWGREDRVTTLKFGERLANELPHARLVVYPQCGHFPMLEAKNASTSELARFLADDAAAHKAADTKPIAPEVKPDAKPAEPKSTEPRPAEKKPAAAGGDGR